jgi:hypothetical protein
MLIVMYEPSCNIFSKTTSLLQSLKFQPEALIPNYNIPISGIKQHKYTTEFMGTFFPLFKDYQNFHRNFSRVSPIPRRSKLSTIILYTSYTHISIIS